MLFIKKSMQNLYLENMNKIFTKNHNFNALRKFDIFFKLNQLSKEMKKKNPARTRKKLANMEYSFICTYLLVVSINI